MHLESQLQTDSVDAAQEQLSLFFRGSASRPAGLPRYGWGRRSRPLPAKAESRFNIPWSWVVSICTRPYVHGRFLEKGILGFYSSRKVQVGLRIARLHDGLP
jgi:hypothetical protein